MSFKRQFKSMVYRPKESDVDLEVEERGLMDNAFAFANNNAICTVSSYIYTGTKGTYSSSSCTVGLALGSVTGFKDVTVNSVEAHMDALVQEPVSAAIEADSVSFQLYSGGVMTFWCDTNLDRGVLSAGCGTDGSSDYWKVKNSQGSSWGESGFPQVGEGQGWCRRMWYSLGSTVASSGEQFIRWTGR